MKHLLPFDRPREKLERLGAAALGDNELVAIVLGSGSREGGVLALANELLTRMDGLDGLTRADIVQLQEVPGVGPARAAQVLAAVELGRRTLFRGPALRPCLRSAAEFASHLVPQYGASPVEQLGVVMLDSKLCVLRIKVVAIGSLDTAIAHPRDVFRDATMMSAAAVVLFHNHPSGDLTPSHDDLELTERMVAAGAVLGIDVVDHIILTTHGYLSLQQAGLLVR
jgi:DNA repair protein RadC